MDVSGMARVAAGVAIGGTAITAGVLTGRAGMEHHKAKTIERGEQNWLDKSGIPGGFPDATALFMGVGALGAAALVGSGSVSGRMALGALPAAAALGAASGWLVGRRVGIFQGERDPGFQVSRERNLAQDRTERAEREQQRAAAFREEQLKEFQYEWAADDDATNVTFEHAADVVMRGYDHNDDGSVDLRPGQPMVADERVADDHGGWRGGAWGPVSDPDSQVETLLPWFSGTDSDKDQVATRAEVQQFMHAKFDANGNDVLDVVEAVRPQGREIDDYDDFDGS